MIIIGIAIKCSSAGPIIHRSVRAGANAEPFICPKFRTMNVGAPQAASRDLISPSKHITPLGRLLRKTSLDELPQLVSVLIGDMSAVGPRPVLFVEEDLIERRKKSGVAHLAPGITGWAQINGRDDVSYEEKVSLDVEYMERQSLAFDVYILVRTVRYVIASRGVSH